MPTHIRKSITGRQRQPVDHGIFQIEKRQIRNHRLKTPGQRGRDPAFSVLYQEEPDESPRQISHQEGCGSDGAGQRRTADNRKDQANRGDHNRLKQRAVNA